MSKPLGEQIVDQTLHAAAAALVAAPLGYLTPLGGALVGLALGLTREFTEWQRKPERGSHPFSGPGSVVSNYSLLDLCFWSMGGVLGSFL